MSPESNVRLSRAFCSARDRNIPVLVAEEGGSGADGDPELLNCLDYGVRCTGWLCPLFSLPTLPPEELLEEAIEVERRRRIQSLAEGKAILERALRERRRDSSDSRRSS